MWRAPELRKTASRGHSRGSKRARWPHRREAEALEGSPRPGLGPELPWRPEGSVGELKRGDGGPRPARPGYGFLLDRGVCVSAGWCSRRLGVALFIGERRGCFGLRRWTPVHGARRRAASVREGEGDGGHTATVGERRRAQDQGDGDEHSALRTVGLAGPRTCSLRRALASASAREELRALRR